MQFLGYIFADMFVLYSYIDDWQGGLYAISRQWQAFRWYKHVILAVQWDLLCDQIGKSSCL